MKKIFMVLSVILCMVISIQAAEVNKQEVLARIAQKYIGMESISGKYQVNIPMMGDVMKVPIDFWQKGNKIRMNMSMNQQGMPKPLEINMLIDKEKMIQYFKTDNYNTVGTLDFNKLPENIRQQTKQQGFMMDSAVINQLSQNLDKISIEEKVHNEKTYYLITVNDINSIKKVSPPNGMIPDGQMATKMLMWINTASLFPEKIEFLKDADTQVMWVDILNISTAPISDSVFKLDIPADAQYFDMADSLNKMTETGK